MIFTTRVGFISIITLIVILLVQQQQTLIIMNTVVATPAFVTTSSTTNPPFGTQHSTRRNHEHEKRRQQQQQQHHLSLIPSQVLRQSKMAARTTSSSVQRHMIPIDASKQQQRQSPQSLSTQQSSRYVAIDIQRAQRQEAQQLPLHSSANPSSTETAATKTSATATITLAQDTNSDGVGTTSNTNNEGNLKRARRRNRTERKKRAAIAAKKASATTPSAASMDTANAARIGASTTTIASMNYQLQSITERTNNIELTSDSIITDGSHFPTSGNLPDIFWRAIPIEHLRDHPNFKALPEPSTIRTLRTLDDVKYFRQDSWQWDTIHHGRCTTSQAVAALGFLESNVGAFLDVPMSWRRGGMGAYVRLSVKPLRTLEEMNQILIDATISNHTKTSIPSYWIKGEPLDVGATNNDETLPAQLFRRKRFAAQYTYRLSPQQMEEQKKYSRKISQNEQMSKGIRMMWGNTQEATSLLTAINYFSQFDANFILEEVGMCGANIPLNITSTSNTTNPFTTADGTIASISSSLLIGATPDGILRHSDGRIEVLEVKNHCPFFSNSFQAGKGTKNKGGKRKRFTVHSKPFDIDEGSYAIFAHYVPQLQLEMLCVGDECRSAVMIRQTATSGAIVLRMHRDDEWIHEMIYWLHRFQLDFVESKKPPPKNFFYDSPNIADRSRYRRFANKTKEIRNSRVELVALIPNHEIQRMGDDSSLFLD